VEYKLKDVMGAPNICDLLTAEERAKIGNECVDGYERDKSSRTDWDERMANANRLALQVTERKSEPWDGASNVMFPLVTAAALAWHARAYPLLMPGTDIAKCRVIGDDPGMKKQERANRIAAHLSYQLLEEDESWEEEQDKCLLVTAIAGNAYKKTYFDPILKRTVSRLVLPSDLIVNYWTKGEINHSPRVSHYMVFSENDIHEREVTERFCKYDDDKYTPRPKPDPQVTDPVKIATDDRQGVTKPQQDDTTPIEYIEQLCWVDLDGDGYKEPYIATVELSTHRLKRLVARYVDRTIVRASNGKVAYIHPQKIYTKYGLIPSPDGGYMDLGFGMLMGPLNDSVNSIVNQLVDCGTRQNYGGGFLGRGAKFRGGKYTFDVGEWKQLDFMGDDIKKVVMALPTNEPSKVLFELMQFLIQYAERIASATDIQQGEGPGQNQKAETTRILNENGSRVFAATFLRAWRSFRNELRIFYYLNTMHITSDKEFENLSLGSGAVVYADDYRASHTEVRPIADPRIVSKELRIRETAQTMDLAFKIPGFNKYKTVRRHLEALGTPSIDEIFPRPKAPPQQGQQQPGQQGGPQAGQPGQPQPQPDQQEPDIQPPPNDKMIRAQVEMGKLQLDQQRFKMEQQNSKIKLQSEVMLIQGKVMELRAKAMKELAEAKDTEKEAIQRDFELRLNVEEARMEGYFKAMDMIQKEMENVSKQSEGSGADAGGTGQGGMGQQPPNTGATGMAPSSGEGHAGGMG
jgi:chaperonin GroES